MNTKTIFEEENVELASVGLTWDMSGRTVVLKHTPQRKVYEHAFPDRREVSLELPPDKYMTSQQRVTKDLPPLAASEAGVILQPMLQQQQQQQGPRVVMVQSAPVQQSMGENRNMEGQVEMHTYISRDFEPDQLLPPYVSGVESIVVTNSAATATPMLPSAFCSRCGIAREGLDAKFCAGCGKAYVA